MAETGAFGWWVSAFGERWRVIWWSSGTSVELAVKKYPYGRWGPAPDGTVASTAEYQGAGARRTTDGGRVQHDVGHRGRMAAAAGTAQATGLPSTGAEAAAIGGTEPAPRSAEPGAGAPGASA
jgi:hypothetical protein